MTTHSSNSDFSTFIATFQSDLKALFDQINNDSQRLMTRGLTSDELGRILSSAPLSVAIPKEYGGRGLVVQECLQVLEAASYQSLPLTLIFGINIALFLEPLAKYGQEAPKAEVYRRFLQEQNMGGLMISEPLHGSDALNIATAHRQDGEKYKIDGRKHWQGLSGDADYWLVASRENKSNDQLSRDISLFLTDNAHPQQHIPIVERYSSSGLYPISYGVNAIDVTVPAEHKLVPESTGIKMLMDVLHRSRMQFPGMAMGFLRRILEETTTYCQERLIRGKSLLQFDQVEYQLAQLQSAVTICSAMCRRSASVSGIDNNLALHGVEANTIKARVTDLMQWSAQTMTQLFGSSGYKITNLGARGIMDSRPFQIFEGPNEMLYAQISEAVTKEIRKKKSSISEYLKSSDLTSSVADFFRSITDQVTIDHSMAQRHHVMMGQVISRVITAAYVERLSGTFDKQLIDNSLSLIRQEVSAIVHRYALNADVRPVEDYQGSISWTV